MGAKIKLSQLAASLRASFWFVPTLLVVAAAGSAAIVLAIDILAGFKLPEKFPLLFGVTAKGARDILSTIASSMITVAGVTFSITIVTLSLASSQYYSMALHFINQGLEKCSGKCDQVIVEGQFALGMTNFHMKDLVSSELHLDSSLVVARNSGNTRFIAENLLFLAQIYFQNERYHLAEHALKESESIALQNDYKELLLDIYRIFIIFFENQRDYRNLSEYHSRYTSLREKLYGKELHEKIVAFQVDLESRENAKTIAYQKQVMALQKEAFAWQRLLYYGLGCIILLLAFITILVYRQVLHKRKVQKVLAKRVSERSSELEDKELLLKHTQHKLKQLIRFAVDTIEGRMRYIAEIQASGLVNNGASMHYVQAVHSTTEQIKVLANAMDEFILSSDF